jgi:Fur family ferric uptake transcriptional regulator
MVVSGYGGRFRPILAPAAPDAPPGVPPDLAEADALLRRFRASRLRPTPGRIAVLAELTRAAPRCLDARQLMRSLIPSIGRPALPTVYRALNELWGAGLLLRSRGQDGRNYYGIGPEGPNPFQATLACRCGRRMVVIGDRALHEQLRSLAGAAGFVAGKESAFAISLTCPCCERGETAGDGSRIQNESSLRSGERRHDF